MRVAIPTGAEAGEPFPSPVHHFLEPRIGAAEDDPAIARVVDTARGLHEHGQRLAGAFGATEAGLEGRAGVPRLLLALRTIDQGWWTLSDGHQDPRA
jgi:hypothetical protein